MSHLTDKQLEEVLQGLTSEPLHLGECPDCQRRLDDARAVRERLQQAFHTVTASEDLAARLHRMAQYNPSSDTSPRVMRLGIQRRLWSILAAAAVILICAIPVSIFMNTGAEAEAAQTALSAMHHRGLEVPDSLFVAEDPAHMADHLENESGIRPVWVDTNGELTVQGCRCYLFKDRKVPTYLVQSPAGSLSITVLEESPRALGLKRDAVLGVWTATHGCCNLAAVTHAGATYAACGDVAHEVLAQALKQLL
jgi:hypothetical protein